MPVNTEFLDERLQLAQKSAGEASVRLQVIVIARGDDRLIFGHLDQRFSVALADVISISDAVTGIANPFNEGFPANLTVSEDAVVHQIKIIRAKDLLSEWPFVISRPSMSQPFTRDPYPAEHDEWLRSRGVEVMSASPERATTSYTSKSTRRDTTRYTTDPNNGSTRVDGIDNDGYVNDGYDPDGYDNDPDKAGVVASSMPLRATTRYTASQSRRDTTRYTQNPDDGSTSVDGIDNDGYYNDDHDPDGYDNDPDLHSHTEKTEPVRATTRYTASQSRRDTTRYTNNPNDGSTSVDGIDNDGYYNDDNNPDGYDNDPDATQL